MKDVVGYEEYFSITEDGKLWSKRSKRFLKLIVNRQGYYSHCTKIGGRNGIAKLFKIHRCVAEAYIDNPNNLPIINHKDGNKLNNNVSNLEWCTHSENSQHAFDTGLSVNAKGENSKLSILTQIQADEIRNLYESGSYTTRKLAKQFDVGKTTIIRILQNEAYLD